MKKKLVLMCMAGVMVAGISACRSSKTDGDAQETMQASEASTVSEEDTDSEAPTEAGRVSDREDYVGLQDLEIDEYITLADYKNMKVNAVRPAVDDESITQYIDSQLLVGTLRAGRFGKATWRILILREKRTVWHLRAAQLRDLSLRSVPDSLFRDLRTDLWASCPVKPWT